MQLPPCAQITHSSFLLTPIRSYSTLFAPPWASRFDCITSGVPAHLSGGDCQIMLRNMLKWTLITFHWLLVSMWHDREVWGPFWCDGERRCFPSSEFWVQMSDNISYSLDEKLCDYITSSALGCHCGGEIYSHGRGQSIYKQFGSEAPVLLMKLAIGAGATLVRYITVEMRMHWL